VDKEIQQAVAAAASHLAKLGAEVEQVGLEFMARHDYVEDHIHIFNFEAVPAIQKVSGGNFDELASSTMWFVRTGSPTRDRYLEARAHMAKLKQQTGKFFRDYDALLIPSVPMPAFPHSNYQSLSGSALIVDGRSVEKVHVTKTTSPWDYTGSPALSVPFSWNADDLPLSVQVVGRRFDEATVLRIGSAIETGSIDSKRSPRL
jgi:aspartyl-tRNA(Asn)/glutamyl-tRNA(Gln) amidotransferase subunit A